MKFVLNQQNVDRIIEGCLERLDVPGSVFLLPTETVYGLCCAADDMQARERIYRMKKRDGRKPMQLLVSDISCLTEEGITVFPALSKVCSAFCPGPITVVVETNKGRSVGFRVPEHWFFNRLLQVYKRPIAATSANLSGEPPCLTVDDALVKFADPPDIVVDNGAIAANSMASTVVKLTPDNVEILREGPVSLVAIRKALDQSAC